MVDTLALNISLTILHAEKHGLSPPKVEVANLTLNIYSMAQGPKANKIGASFQQLASDVVSGMAAALAYTPQPDQSCVLLILGILHSIERLGEEKLSQNSLCRLWRHKSVQRKIASYQDSFQQQLAIYRLQSDLVLVENLAQIQTAQRQGGSTPTAERPAAPMVLNDVLGLEGESVIQPSALTAPSNHYQQKGHGPHDPCTEPRSQRSPNVEHKGRTTSSAPSHQYPTITRSSEPGDSTAKADLPPGPHPPRRAQATSSTPPRRTAQQPPESCHSRSTAVATGHPPSPPHPPSSPQIPHPLILGSQITIFIIGQLNANFPSTTTNFDSENVTTTTLTDVANDSSYRSA